MAPRYIDKGIDVYYDPEPRLYLYCNETTHLIILCAFFITCACATLLYLRQGYSDHALVSLLQKHLANTDPSKREHKREWLLGQIWEFDFLNDSESNAYIPPDSQESSILELMMRGNWTGKWKQEDEEDITRGRRRKKDVFMGEWFEKYENRDGIISRRVSPGCTKYEF